MLKLNLYYIIDIKEGGYFMAKLIMCKVGTIQQAYQEIENNIYGLGVSLEKVDQIVSSNHTFMVYQKYYYRASNYVSLSVVLSQMDSFVCIEAITSAAGQGVVFKFSWGSEESFLDEFEAKLKKLGYQKQKAF